MHLSSQIFRWAGLNFEILLSSIFSELIWTDLITLEGSHSSFFQRIHEIWVWSLLPSATRHLYSCFSYCRLPWERMSLNLLSFVIDIQIDIYSAWRFFVVLIPIETIFCEQFYMRAYSSLIPYCKVLCTLPPLSCWRRLLF